MRATLTYHYGTPGQGGDTIKFRTNTSHRYIVATVNGNGKVVTEYRTDDYSRAVAKLDKVRGFSGRIFDTEDCTMRGTDTENNGERGASFRWWYVGPGMSKVSGQRGPSYRATAAVDRDAVPLTPAPARRPGLSDYSRGFKSGQTPSADAITRADARGESAAWYTGFYDAERGEEPAGCTGIDYSGRRNPMFGRPTTPADYGL